MKKRAGAKPPPSGKSNPASPLNRLPQNAVGGSRAPAAVWAACLALAVLTFAVFGRTIRYDFVEYDDKGNVYENTNVSAGLTMHGLSLALTHGSDANWDPLTTISHMVDCQIYGLRAGGHHLTNVLLHTASVILLFLVLRQMTGAFWRSVLVAAIFAIHPLRVESVAWVSERKDTLSGVFFMLTLGAYVRYTRQPGRSAYLLVVLCFVLGLMSKAMLVTLPFVLLLLDWWPLNRWKPPTAPARSAGGRSWLNGFAPPRNLILEKLPLLALSLGSCVIAAFAQSHAKAIQSLEKYPFSLRLGNALNSVFVYVAQMFHPAGLAAFYPYPAHLPSLPALLLLAAALMVVSFGAFKWRRLCPCFLVGWLWYLGMLAPVIGLVQLGAQSHADRYTYLPQIGLYVALVWFAESALLPRWIHRRAVFAGAAVLVVAGLAVAAIRQVSFWRNTGELWTHALECTSGNTLALYDLANIQLRQGRVDEAAAHLEALLRIDPNDWAAHSDLGSALLVKGRLDDAAQQYQAALRLDPDYAEANNNLAFILIQKQRPDEAIVLVTRSLKVQPDNANAHFNFATALLQKSRTDDAVAELETALKLQPDFPLAQRTLAGVAWTLATSPAAAARNGPRALELAQQAARFSGGRDPMIVGTLAAAYAELGRFPDAVAAAQRAIALTAGQPDPAAAANLRKQLADYEAGRPFRDSR